MLAVKDKQTQTGSKTFRLRYSYPGDNISDNIEVRVTTRSSRTVSLGYV